MLAEAVPEGIACFTFTGKIFLFHVQGAKIGFLNFKLAFSFVLAFSLFLVADAMFTGTVVSYVMPLNTELTIPSVLAPSRSVGPNSPYCINNGPPTCGRCQKTLRILILATVDARVRITTGAAGVAITLMVIVSAIIT